MLLKLPHHARHSRPPHKCMCSCVPFFTRPHIFHIYSPRYNCRAATSFHLLHYLDLATNADETVLFYFPNFIFSTGQMQGNWWTRSRLLKHQRYSIPVVPVAVGVSAPAHIDIWRDNSRFCRSGKGWIWLMLAGYGFDASWPSTPSPPDLPASHFLCSLPISLTQSYTPYDMCLYCSRVSTVNWWSWSSSDIR
jgi:hypothetical protein